MALVSAMHFKLMRARKSLEKAHLNRDWRAVRHWDSELADCLNAVFSDRERDAKSLITELERLLATYANIIAELPEDVGRCTFRPTK